MKVKLLLVFFIFVMGCSSPTTTIVQDGPYGVRIKYVGHRSYHLHSRDNSSMKIAVLKHVCNTKKYGEVYTRTRKRHPRQPINNFGKRKR